jgi:hypothetical protein
LGLLDEIGWYVSGEFGHYWFGTTNFVPVVFAPAIALPDYNTWNVGVAFTWKVATLDLRYYDTDLSKLNCNVLTGDPNALVTAAGNVSKWCGAAFIAAFKVDLTAMANLKYANSSVICGRPAPRELAAFFWAPPQFNFAPIQAGRQSGICTIQACGTRPICPDWAFQCRNTCWH